MVTVRDDVGQASTVLCMAVGTGVGQLRGVGRGVEREHRGTVAELHRTGNDRHVSVSSIGAGGGGSRQGIDADVHVDGADSG